MPRRRRYRQVPWALPIVAAAVLAATYLSARPALAAGSFTTTVVGSAVAESAVMPMGKPATATIVQGSVGLEWAPATYGSGREVGAHLASICTGHDACGCACGHDRCLRVASTFAEPNPERDANAITRGDALANGNGEP